MKRAISLFSATSSQLLKQKPSTALFAASTGAQRTITITYSSSRINNISRTKPVILPIPSVDTKQYTTITRSSRVITGFSNTKSVAASSLFSSRQFPVQRSFAKLFASSGFRSTSSNHEINESTPNAEYVERTDTEEVHSEEEHHIDTTRSDLQQRTGPVIRMIIQAYHFARNIDIARLNEEMKKERWYRLERNALILHFAPNPVLVNPHYSFENTNFVTPMDRFMIAFKFGSVVFINCEESLQLSYLQKLREFSIDFVDKQTKDDYGVIIDPQLEKWSKTAQDYIMVKELDLYNVNIIAEILARTVALQNYEERVEDLLTDFRDINKNIENDVKLHGESRKLVQIVARNNIVMTDLLLNVRLLERPEISWKYSKYYEIYEHMYREFELHERFANINKKVELIQNNTMFYMEMLHSKKSNRQEWLIIWLISAELVVGLAPYVSGWLTAVGGWL